MKFKDLPISDKDILEGRKPLPEEATYLMEKYSGKGKVFNPDLDYPDTSKPRREGFESFDLYKPMNEADVKARETVRTLMDVYSINPQTGEMIPREGISPEQSKRYFDIIKRHSKEYFPTDNPKLNQFRRGAVGDQQDPIFSDLGMYYSPKSGELIKGNNPPRGSVGADIIRKDLEVGEFQKLSPYSNLLESVKGSYKNLPEEKRIEMQNKDLIEILKTNPKLQNDMDVLKKYQQKVIDKYKEHAKKYGQRA